MEPNQALVFTLGLIAVLLALAGFIGSVLPLMPGPVLILAGGVINRVFLWDNSPVSWTVLGILLVAFGITCGVDFLATALGAKKFGASKWGVGGAILGAIVGIFFGIPGLILGPVAGALLGELIAGKKLDAASKASFGTIIGNLFGMLGKVSIAAVMMSLLIADLFWIDRLP